MKYIATHIQPYDTHLVSRSLVQTNLSVEQKSRFRLVQATQGLCHYLILFFIIYVLSIIEMWHV